jgi:hypothetical protein
MTSVYKVLMRAAFLVGCVVGSSACGTVDDAQTKSTQDVVTTNLTTYMQGQNIVVTYNGMQGAPSDWIAIARTTDADTVTWLYKYTGGGTSGMITFTNPTLPQGTYEARAYYNWAGTSSYTVQQRSAPFTVGGNAMLAASQNSYATGAPVVINYSGFSGASTDWISIHTPNSPDTQYIAFQYTGGGTSGMRTFTNLPTGIYEARYHANWNGTHSFASSAKSPQFSVGNVQTISTDKPTYGSGQTVTVSYTNMPGNMLDYIAVSTAGSPPSSTVQRFYTNGQTNGTQQFSGLAAGNYEARAYLNDTTTILATKAFSVSAASVTTTAATYDTATPVTVDFSGLPGNQLDWIAIAPAGSADSTYTTSQYTNGQVMGSMQFANLPPGNYEARAYANNTFQVLARSSAFTVAQACVVAPDAAVFESLTSGDVTIGASDVIVNVPLTVATDRSILFMSVRERETSPQHGAVFCELHPADVTNNIDAGIRCRRNFAGTDTSGSSGALSIHWTVVTFTSGVTVQRGIAITAPTNPTTATLTAIDPNSSFVVLDGMLANGTGWGGNEFTRARIVDATTLEVAHSVSGATVSWQVVSMAGASVQRGSTTIGTAATTQSVAIASAPLGSMILSSYTSDNATTSPASALMLQATFSGNSILFERGAGGTNLDVAYEVVSLPFSTRLGTTRLEPGVGTAAATVTGISPTSSVAIGSMQSILGQSGGWTTFASTDLVGEAAATMTTATDSVLIQRASTTARASIPWTVIDFSRDCAGN